MSCFPIAGDMALNADETDCVFIEGLTAVKQQIQTGAQVFRERWQFDRNAGVDYEDVFVKDPDLRLVRLVFFDFLNSIPGVVDVTSLDLRVETQTRTLFVSFEVSTDFGNLQDTIALQFAAP